MGVPVLPDVDLILQRLKEGRLDAFVNSFEWSKFECKASPYQLDSADQKFELAKDVSAMANVDGGVILIGARTAKAETGRTEIVTEISAFPPNTVDTSQMADVLREWLYPPLRDLQIAWYPRSDDRSKGVVAILVPKAAEDLRPVLVVKGLKDTGRIRGNAFAVFERWQEETTYFNPEQLHALIRSGQNSQSLLQRMEALQVSVDASISEARAKPVPTPAPSAAPGAEPGRASSSPRIAPAASYAADVGLSSLSAYILRGIPVAPLSIPGIFASQQTPVRALVQDPPKVRYGSFGVDGGGPAQIHRGQSWRSMHVDAHRLLDIHAGGQVTFAAPADESFLCWGKHQTADAKRLNPVVLIESIYIFAELLRQLQALTEPKNVGYTLRVTFERFRQTGQVVVLSPGLLHAFGLGLDLREAPDDNATFEGSWVQGEIVPATLAFDCIARAYEWFGFTHDKIPLTKLEGGKQVVDVDAIKALR